MKKILTLICTLLCANMLFAQDYFLSGQLYYAFNSDSSVRVYFYNSDNPPTDLIIPETVTYQGTTYSVTSIGERAFLNCSSLTSITIPNSVTYIGGGVFGNCSSLTSVTLSNNITELPLFSYLYSNGYSYCGFFENCSSLTSVTIPNSVTSIGERAFSGCSSLTSITIPNSVTSIGGGVFYNCSSLTSVTLSNNITGLPCHEYYDNFYNSNGFFENCSSLTSVVIPNSVTSIGGYAFSGCSSLTSVVIPNSVTSIGYEAFENCSSLTSVTIPNSVTSIVTDAFLGCNNLTSVTVEMNNIPNLSNIGLNSILQNLTLGENVTSIASGAFNNCSFLQNVTCLATTPPTLADNTVFPYPNIATLTVPCGTLEAYSAPTSFWNMFFMGRISEDGYDVVANVNNDAFGSVAIENNCSTATLTATANEGYVFLSWNDGNTDNPRVVSLTSDTSFVANFALIDESSLLEAEEESISFFPNPTKSEITFSQAIEKVEVIDLIGKTILTFTNAKTINIESLPAGAYYLRLTNEEKTSLQKVIKQ